MVLEMHLRMEILGQMAVWRSGGFRVAQLETASKGEIAQLKREYERAKRGVGRLQQIERGLRDLDAAGIDTDDLRPQVRDVDRVDDVARRYEELRRQFDERIPSIGASPVADPAEHRLALPAPAPRAATPPTPATSVTVVTGLAGADAGAVRLVPCLLEVLQRVIRAVEPALPTEMARSVERRLWRNHPQLVQVMIRGDGTVAARIPDNERSAEAISAFLGEIVAELETTLGAAAAHKLLRDRLGGTTTAWERAVSDERVARHVPPVLRDIAAGG